MNPGKLVVKNAALLALCLAIPARAQIAGFGGTNWTLNNDPASQSVPYITNNVLYLADSVMTANSAFYDIPQYIGSFTASFTFQNLQANDAEGLVFALQNQGTNAVSTVGGNYLGFYGLSLATGIAFDISPREGPDPVWVTLQHRFPGADPEAISTRGPWISGGQMPLRSTSPMPMGSLP